MRTKAGNYDLCGNMIVRHGGSTGSQALEYDAENQLVRFSEAGTRVVEFGYSADGQRLWKRKNQTELQVWIGNTYEEKGGKTLFHVFAGGQRICTFEPGSVLAGGDGGSDTHVGYYYHQDMLNSSSALSGSSGEQLEVNVWYPFGRTQTASPQAAVRVSNRFTGQVFDDETGLYYYNARYYDPELGRFIQADTVIPDLGNPQSYNRYAYCLNNPLSFTDPSGHGPKEWAQNTFNFAGGAVAGFLSILNPVPVQVWGPGMPPPTTTAEYYGRKAGETVGVTFSAAEVGFGGTMMVGGGGVSFTGVGAIAGVPAAILGTAVAGHGVVGINNYVFNSTTRPPGGTGKAHVAGSEPVPNRTLNDPLPPNPKKPTEADPHAPDPAATGPHTVVGTRTEPKKSPEPYIQGITYDANGNPVGRTDVTTHGRGDHTNPHWHPYDPTIPNPFDRENPGNFGPQQPMPK